MTGHESKAALSRFAIVYENRLPGRATGKHRQNETVMQKVGLGRPWTI
jgi:hypothetical protein